MPYPHSSWLRLEITRENAHDILDLLEVTLEQPFEFSPEMAEALHSLYITIMKSGVTSQSQIARQYLASLN